VNSTFPFTFPPYCPVTVAVKVTVWFSDDGFGVEVKLVVVVAPLTVCVKAPELAAKLESPE
jgi:hypothetical protein